MSSQLRSGAVVTVEYYLTKFPDDAGLVSGVYEQMVKPFETKDQSYDTNDKFGDWFYFRNQIAIGPFTLEQLQQLARAGDLHPKDLVRGGGTTVSIEAAAVPGLFASAGTNVTNQSAPGQRVRDDYVLLEMVGRGGMGEVYKAYRFSLQKEVALKIVRRDRFQTLPVARQAAMS